MSNEYAVWLRKLNSVVVRRNFEDKEGRELRRQPRGDRCGYRGVGKRSLDQPPEKERREDATSGWRRRNCPSKVSRRYGIFFKTLDKTCVRRIFSALPVSCPRLRLEK